MADGIGPDDIAAMEKAAGRFVEQGPVDEVRLGVKIGHAVDLMVNMILTGEKSPRSAAEAVNVAEGLVRIAGALKVDAAALAAAVAHTERAASAVERFQTVMQDHIVTLEAEKDASPG
jgi:hypothetical protein